MLGAVGSALGLLIGVAAFLENRTQDTRFSEDVQNFKYALASGDIERDQDGLFWRKSGTGQRIQVVFEPQAPSHVPTPVLAALPVFGFMVPWGAVLVTAWVIDGFKPKQSRQTIFCGDCGERMSPDWRTCPNCGAKAWKHQNVDVAQE